MRQRAMDEVFLFLMVRLAIFESGIIHLSDEHADFRWVGPDEWQALKFPEFLTTRLGYKRFGG